MIKLFYGPNSPYTRKVRVVLREKGLQFQEELTDLGAPSAEFAAANPNMRIPCMVDGEHTLFESNVMLDYLLKTYPGVKEEGAQPPLTESLTRPERHWEDMMVIVTIETLLDSALNLFFMSRDGLTPEQAPFMNREQARIQSGLDWLEARAAPEGFWPGAFSIMDLNLVIALVWGDFRGMFKWNGRPRLEAIVDRHRQRPSLLDTQPGG